MRITILSSKTLMASMVWISVLLLPACNHKNNHSVSVPASVSQDNDALFKKYNLANIKMPAGFSINVYAEINGARSLCVSPSGTVFVGTREGGKVYAIKDGNLYIGTISTIYRLDNIESRLDNPPAPIVVYDKYPTDEHHGPKFIAF